MIQPKEEPTCADFTSPKDWDLRGNKRRGVGDSWKKFLNPLQKKDAVENGTSVYSLMLLRVPFGLVGLPLPYKVIQCWLKCDCLHWQCASKPGAVELSSVLQV